MKKFVVLLPAVALAMFVVAGCGGKTKAPAGGKASGDKPKAGSEKKAGSAKKPGSGDATGTGENGKAKVVAVKFSLCGKCGQVADTEACCDKNAKKCEKCSLAFGSPGCCKITKGKDTALCSKCGHIAGKDPCCKAGAEKCPKCSLVKGSPLCCKIKVAATKGGSGKEPFPDPEPEKDAPKDKGT